MQTKSDAFAKSIELLGNKSPAVRQGGIYALGRIAKDNPEDHMTVIRIVTSYIRKESRDIFNPLNPQRKRRRTSSPAHIRLLLPSHIKPSQKSETESEEFCSVSQTKDNTKYLMPVDIEAAIEVIRKRDIPKQEEDEYQKSENYISSRFVFDISNACLSNVDFSGVKLSKTNFSDSKMLDCIFEGANLSNSSFVSSNLRGSSFENCDLAKADLRNCDLTGADLAKAKNLEQEQINEAKIDDNTTLPPGIQCP